MIQEYIVPEEFSGVRIDKFLSESCPLQSRSFLQKLLKSELVDVDGKTVKSSYKVSAGETVSFEAPEAVEAEITAQEMPLDILYEDQDVILINKPKGMVVHPAAGHYEGTLVNGLMHHCRDQLSGINGVMRPGIVHRIDMDTTGVIIACKNDLAHNSIAEQLKVHSITRKYYAVVFGNLPDDEGTVAAPIGRHPTDRKKMSVISKNGKDAVTHYRVLERFRGYTYVECRLETGRTHQIRVHMASIGHPLLGDQVYGPSKQPFHLNGQTLHAGVLGFIHPRTGEYMEFTAPLPDYFEELLTKLRRLT
ncbi:RluA family pseudouridine synthase [[Clostridium] symbiosum]|uniref:RluA family pseudouridine synthase n=1 Tax=Clostridium symbiosum TaxID=1512 RepID=UPI001D0955D9|nr:RluA family pseudouridine synthase [[Clostridium] symbiosum]MCB6608921.1 RluA family pseudouridine synthase [[Clostridium] symbiosum]MCB6930152.1 RluA family pseudouridine synthase [[Clostridium] symbiosum]